MNAVLKAKARTPSYPRLIANCRNESKIYATCVSSKQDVPQNACLKDFQNFENYLIRSAAKLETRL